MNIYKYKYSTKTSRHLAVQNICCFENEALFCTFDSRFGFSANV